MTTAGGDDAGVVRRSPRQDMFAIFDAFRDEAGRQAHLNRPIAAALMAKAPNLFTTPPVIESLEILGREASAVTTGCGLRVAGCGLRVAGCGVNDSFRL